MNYKHILLVSALLPLGVFANESSDSIRVDNRLDTLEERLTKIETQIQNIQKKNKEQDRELQSLLKADREIESAVTNQALSADSMRTAIRQHEGALTAAEERLDGNIADANKSLTKTNQTISQHLWGGIIALVLTLGGLVVLFVLLRKRIASSNTSIADVKRMQEEMQQAQTKLQEESVGLDNKLIEIMEKQLAIAKTTQPATTASNQPQDHSLALKVADEVVRIEINLSRMDASIKGHRHLSRAIERIKNNFLAQGYEITDLLGKSYNEGMKIDADFVSDETLAAGCQIITGITKPQVLYHGELIQRGKVVVSQNF